MRLRGLDVAGESVIVDPRRARALRPRQPLPPSRQPPAVRPRNASAGPFAARTTVGRTRTTGELHRVAVRRTRGRPGSKAAACTPSASRVGAAFCFLHLSPERAERDGATLLAQLGPVPERARALSARRLRVAQTMRYDVAANWKVILENYNECYHCAGVHPELCRIVPAFKARGGAELDWERGIPHRDGAWTFTESGTTNRAAVRRSRRRRGKSVIKASSSTPTSCSACPPNTSPHFRFGRKRPSRTAIVCDMLFHPQRNRQTNGFDPSDAADFWDIVNRQDWRVCEGVQAGMQSRRFEYGYYAPMEDYSLDIRRYIEASPRRRAPSTNDAGEAAQ